MHVMQEVEETVGLREPEPEPSGLRERKKRARREALVDATHRLAAEHGLENVTVEAICAEVGISVRTFFNYFETKDDAVLGLGQWSLDPDASEVFAAGGPTGDLLADLQVLVRSILERPPLGPDRMARAFELAKQHPDLLVRAYVLIHNQHEAARHRRRLGDRRRAGARRRRAHDGALARHLREVGRAGARGRGRRPPAEHRHRPARAAPRRPGPRHLTPIRTP
jgi:AcrR family transcriptional regulator